MPPSDARSAAHSTDDDRDPLGVSIDGATATLTLRRPRRGNALDDALVAALSAAFESLARDAVLHTWILRGSGTHFCTGFDLADIDDRSDGDLLARFIRVECMLQQLARAPVRTIAVAEGRAFGAGADLFAAADLRVAGPRASFAFPGPRFGLVLGTRRLASRIGADLARRVLLEGRTLDSTEAFAAGLATLRCEGDVEQFLEQMPAPVVDPPALTLLLQQTRVEADDADLATLVRSASRPGLVERVRAYRNSIRKR